MSSRADERIKRSVLFAFVAVNTLQIGDEDGIRTHACKAELAVQETKVLTHFIVVKRGRCLVGYSTATELGILHVGPQLHLRQLHKLWHR